jgi:mannose-1-phosphate guanylyltransferase
MVMAAGLGRRLRPLTDFLPPSMVPIANRPLLHHLLNLLRRHDVEEVGINLHAKPEMIEGYFGDGSALGMSIRWSHEPELLGTAGGTKKLEDFWGGETILVTSGDGLHDIDVTALLGHHRRTEALATLAVKPVDDPSGYGVVILDREGRVRGFQEKPARTEARSDLANCGVYVIEPGVLERIPADTFVDFGTDLWPSLVAAGEAIYAYTTPAYWNDIGDLDALRDGILDALLGNVRVELPGEEIEAGIWAEEGCRIDPSAEVHSPVVIGRNAVVEAGAHIHGPVTIGAESHVGREAAIRRAALLPGSVVPDEGLAIAGIFGDASKLAEATLRYPAKEAPRSSISGR